MAYRSAVIVRFKSVMIKSLYGMFFINGFAYGQEVIDLWQNQAMPYYKENNVEEYQEDCWQGKMCVYNVVKPTLTIYRAQGVNSGKAVIILPGGGYETLAITHEGYEVAEALAKQGITSAVLKYRLPNPTTSTMPSLTPLADVRESISLLRKIKAKYGISSDDIGVLGFSAGGHLATVASLRQSENSAENPDFSVLIYGVTKLNSENKKWLEDSLYFHPLNKQQIAENTLLKLVTPQTPPAFLAHAYDDVICHYTESTLYSEALSKQGVDSELHLFAQGGHGFGLGMQVGGSDQWLDLAANWVKRL